MFRESAPFEILHVWPHETVRPGGAYAWWPPRGLRQANATFPADREDSEGFARRREDARISSDGGMGLPGKHAPLPAVVRNAVQIRSVENQSIRSRPLRARRKYRRDDAVSGIRHFAVGPRANSGKGF